MRKAHAMVADKQMDLCQPWMNYNLHDSTAHQKDVYNVFGGVRVFVSIVGPLRFITFRGDA